MEEGDGDRGDMGIADQAYEIVYQPIPARLNFKIVFRYANLFD